MQQKFEKFILRKSESLKKAKIANILDVELALSNVGGFSYNDLTSIDRSIDDNQTIENDSNGMTRMLKEIRKKFLTERMEMPGWEGFSLHPMDVINRVLLKSSPESCRILIQNLEKMKFALPLVIPRRERKPKILAWPFIDIHCRNEEVKFNLFQQSHHVIAFIRLGKSFQDVRRTKSSTYSNARFINRAFFNYENESNQPFIPRKHLQLRKVIQRAMIGSIETAIHYPNERLNHFFQVWNLYGNIAIEGLEPQIDFISRSASAIIVHLDDDEVSLIEFNRLETLQIGIKRGNSYRKKRFYFQDIEKIEKILLKKFASKNIIILVPFTQNTESIDVDDIDTTTISGFQCLKYEKGYEDDIITDLHAKIENCMTSGMVLQCTFFIKCVNL